MFFYWFRSRFGQLWRISEAKVGENQEIQDSESNLALPFRKHDVIFMTCDFDNSYRAIYRPSLITRTLRPPEIFMEEGRIQLLSPSRRPERKPR